MSTEPTYYSDFRLGDLAVHIIEEGDPAPDGDVWENPGGLPKGAILMVSDVMAEDPEELDRCGFKYDLLEFADSPGGKIFAWNSAAFRRLDRLEEIEAKRQSKEQPTQSSAAPQGAGSV